MSFKPTKIHLPLKPQDLRLGISLCNLSTADFVLLGYPDDEGVKNNGGRIGAAGGPDAFRQILYKTTAPSYAKDFSKLHDLGDLDVANITEIADRHKAVVTKLKELHADNKKILSIGGGHDYGYPDSIAFYQSFADKKPLVINFDAHLDLRPTEEKIGSGTPFYRLLEEAKVDLIEIGLLQVCNQKKHLEYLYDHGGKAIFYEDLNLEGKSLIEKFSEIMGEELIRRRTVFLSIDLDVFSSAFAPACSQSWPFSMQPYEFFPLLELILKRWDVRAMGIYELAPQLDENFKTSRLATQIAYNFLYS